MRVYVDELPKKCKDCVCFNGVNGRCQLKHLYIDMDLEPIDCPLKSLSEHDKQVRKELIKEIKKKILNTTGYDTEEEIHNYIYDLNAGTVFDMLDEIQGE